jgi:hypothetical protein
MPHSNISRAITTGISYIAAQQLSSGNFTNYSSSSLLSFHTKKTHSTTFIPSLILLALNTINQEQSHLTPIKTKLSHYLLTQKSDHWTWNYWDRESPEYTKRPYPDDLDDTSLALFALYQHNPSSIDGQALAHITQVLTELEIKEGGPYRTWLVGKETAEKWRDVDVVVNSNIAAFLSLYEVELPQVISFIEKAVRSEKLTSPYYPTPHPFLYSISRWYRGKLTSKLINTLTGLITSNQHPLYTALILSSLVRLDYTDRKKIGSLLTALLDSQLPDGSWPAAGICYDPSVAGKPHFAGSPALTTALALEALSLASKVIDAASSTTPTLHTTIWESVEKDLVALPSALSELATAYVEKLKQTDKHQHIALFPTHFAHSISNDVSLELLQALGEATIWGWLAYTTLDDVIDEMAPSSLLPLSYTALSKFHSIYYHQFPPSSQFLDLYNHLLHTMDAALARELLFGRTTIAHNTLVLPNSLPDYSDITVCAEKSIGHAIGPLAVLFNRGYDRYSQPVQLWLQFMHHYLTAKQLHDDAHDWEDDLKLGHLTPVVTLVIKNASSSLTLDEKTFTKLRLHFWHHAIDEVSALITDQLTRARQAIIQNPIITKPQLWFSLLENIDESTKKALIERDHAVQFIEQYHS